MTKKLIINVARERCNSLLLGDNEIVEYHEEKINIGHRVGDVFVGKVQRIVQGLNAAFVKIGHEKDSFLHYFDVAPHAESVSEFIQQARAGKGCDIEALELKPPTKKGGKISEVLKPGQRIIAQVAKEVIHSKGLRVSSSIALPGRYLILVPFGNEILISQKIRGAKERARLEQLVDSIQPNNFSVIARTVAKGQGVATLNEDLQMLLQRWEEGMKLLPKAEYGQKLISEFETPYSILRDTLDEDFDQIIIDHKETYENVKGYLERIYPEKKDIVNFYQGKKNVFDYLTISKKLDSLLGKTVHIKGGGYVIIEQTEALCSIDVNTGNSVTGSTEQERIVLQVNIAAAQEIARQLRLRDIGGLIVIDFIDMKDSGHRKEVLQTMKKYLKGDTAKFDLLPLNKFCLMQLTRSRVRPAIIKENKEVCPTCQGSGKIQSSLALVGTLEEQLKLLLVGHKLRNIRLHLHPYVYAYFHQRLLANEISWILEYWRWVQVVADDKLAVTDFKIFSEQGGVVAQALFLKHAVAKRRSKD